MELSKRILAEFFEWVDMQAARLYPMGLDPKIMLSVVEISNCESKQTISGYQSHGGKILFKISDHQQSPAPSRGLPHTPSSAGSR
jgi:hypothetical protein